MKNNFKRCLALLLALMTIVGAFAIPVSAAEECDHNWIEYDKKDPTCTTVGYTTYVCTKCDEYNIPQDEVVAKLSHNYVKQSEQLNATCGTTGYVAGAEVCSHCGDVKNPDHVIKKNGKHVWDASKGEKFEGSICTTGKVVTKKYCALCKDWLVVSEVQSTVAGHVFEYEVITYPTCAAEGKALKTCKNCNDYEVEIKIEKLAHAEADEYVAEKNFDGKVFDVAQNKVVDDEKSTDTKCVEVLRCKNCNVALDSRVASDPDHDFKYISEADSCGEPGYNLKECKVCKRQVKETVNINHVHNGVAKKVVAGKHTKTELVEGYSLYDCIVCEKEFKIYDDKTKGAANFHTIGAKGTKLDYDENEPGTFVAPTCVEQGYGRYLCDCGYNVLGNIPATGHKYDEIQEPERCDRKYYLYKECSVCLDKVTVKEFAPVTTHSKTDNVGYKAPTCFEDGWQKYGCSKCTDKKYPAGFVVKTETIKKIVHTTSVTYEERTNGKSGCYEERIDSLYCPECDAEKITYRFLSDNGHLFTKTELSKATCHITGKEGYKCGREFCGVEEITKTLPFDSNNHTGGKESDTKHYYVGVDGKQYEITPGELLDITFAKTGVNAEYSCVEVKYTWWYCEGCDREFQEVSVLDADAKPLSPKDLETYKGEYFVSGSGKHILEVKAYNSGKAPTCTTTGVATLECIVAGCNHEKKDQVVPALGHEADLNKEIVTQRIDPTCIKVGYKYYECVRNCGGTVRVEVKATGTHIKNTKAASKTAPTCTEEGLEIYKCTTCDKVMEEKVLEKVPHGTMKTNDKKNPYYSETKAKAETCTADGNIFYYTCTKCKTKYTGTADEFPQTVPETVVIKALGHKVDKTVVYATNTADCVTYGYVAYACERADECGLEMVWSEFEAENQHVAKKDNKGKVIIDSEPATCANYAYTYKTCDVCGERFGQEYDTSSPKPPHINKDGYVLLGDCQVILGDEDCDCKGTGVMPNGSECADCGPLYHCANDLDKDAKKVKECDEFVPATCNFVKLGEYPICNAVVSQCKFCDEFKHEALDPTKEIDHTFMPNPEASVEPTVTEYGYKVSTCIVCQYSEIEQLDKLPAVVFSMNAYNPNGGNIVNGGLVYVDVDMKTLEAIEVNNIRVAIKFKQSDLIFSGVVGSKSVFGNLSSEPEANDKDGTVYVFDDAGKERYNITLDGEMTFVTLAFYVKPTAYDDKDRLVSELEFTAKFTDEKLKDYEPSVSYYDSEKDAYSDYSFDITTNDKIDLSIDQLGDVNNDGKINNYDLVAVRDAMAEGTAYDAVLDIDHDGEITIKDYKLIKEYMVAKYYYWQFADLDSYNEYLGTKDSKANDETAYMKWLDPSYIVKV